MTQADPVKSVLEGEKNSRTLILNLKQRSISSPPGAAGQCQGDCWQAMNQANALYYSRAQGNQKGP